MVQGGVRMSMTPGRPKPSSMRFNLLWPGTIAGTPSPSICMHAVGWTQSQSTPDREQMNAVNGSRSGVVAYVPNMLDPKSLSFYPG